jgi:hypothetical protein
MANLILAPEQEKEIASLNPIIQRMWDIKVNPDTINEAGELVRIATERIKMIDDMRMNKTRPLDALKKDWMNFFETLKQAPEKATFALRAKINAYLSAEKERIKQAEEEAFRKAKEEADKLATQADFLDKMGDLKTAVDIRSEADKSLQADFTIEKVKIKGLSTKETYKFKITNEALIPREYLIPDEKKIGEAVRKSKGNISIEGIECYTEDVLAVRS